MGVESQKGGVRASRVVNTKLGNPPFLTEADRGSPQLRAARDSGDDVRPQPGFQTLRKVVNHAPANYSLQPHAHTSD